MTPRLTRNTAHWRRSWSPATIRSRAPTFAASRACCTTTSASRSTRPRPRWSIRAWSAALRALGLRSFKDYCVIVGQVSGREERQAMAAALTTNVTRFFREPHHFEHSESTSCRPCRPGAAGRSGAAVVGRLLLRPGALFAGAHGAVGLPRGGAPRRQDPRHRYRRTMLEQAREGLYARCRLADRPDAAPPLVRARSTGDGERQWSVGEELRAWSRSVAESIGVWPMPGRSRPSSAATSRSISRSTSAASSGAPRLLTPDGRSISATPSASPGPPPRDLRSDGVSTYRLRREAAPMKPVRVLIVDDSASMRAPDPRHADAPTRAIEVVGEAADPLAGARGDQGAQSRRHDARRRNAEHERPRVPRQDHAAAAAAGHHGLVADGARRRGDDRGAGDRRCRLRRQAHVAASRTRSRAAPRRCAGARQARGRGRAGGDSRVARPRAERPRAAPRSTAASSRSAPRPAASKRWWRSSSRFPARIARRPWSPCICRRRSRSSFAERLDRICAPRVHEAVARRADRARQHLYRAGHPRSSRSVARRATALRVARRRPGQRPSAVGRRAVSFGRRDTSATRRSASS